MTPISLQNVTKKYGPTAAVDNVNIEIAAGELFFLLGPSGCGKTTLLRMIAGLIDATGGRIRFGQRDVTHVPTGERNTAMVFQNYALWPHMSVRDNVAFGLDVRKLDSTQKKERIARALGLVRMDSYADRKPAQLSGGQQQRVALARAIAVQPDVLLLDEPLSNLDAKLRHELRSEIRRICKESEITAVYVTHDQEEALTMADRIALLQDGHLRQVGSPREIYDRPVSKFVAGFLGSTNFIQASAADVSSNMLAVDSPIGRLHSTVFPAAAARGTPVLCSIRPEAVRLLNGNDRADNEVRGRLTSTVYQGYMAQHTFAIANAVTLTLNEFKPRPTLPVDGEVRIGFDAADLIVLAE